VEESLKLPITHQPFWRPEPIARGVPADVYFAGAHAFAIGLTWRGRDDGGGGIGLLERKQRPCDRLHDHMVCGDLIARPSKMAFDINAGYLDRKLKIVLFYKFLNNVRSKI